MHRARTKLAGQKSPLKKPLEPVGAARAGPAERLRDGRAVPGGAGSCGLALSHPGPRLAERQWPFRHRWAGTQHRAGPGLGLRTMPRSCGLGTGPGWCAGGRWRPREETEANPGRSGFSRLRHVPLGAGGRGRPAHQGHTPGQQLVVPALCQVTNALDRHGHPVRLTLFLSPFNRWANGVLRKLNCSRRRFCCR